MRAMEEAGLAEIHRLAPVGKGPWIHLTGELIGRDPTEVVLTAHYDTVAADTGELDNASGCVVIVDAAATLSRVPRRHTVRLLFTDGEENRAAGSRAWLAGVSAQDRRRVLANLNVDMVGSADDGRPGVVHIVAAGGVGSRVSTPAWLVHALMRAADSTGWPIVVLDSRWSWLAQLAVRITRPLRVSDSRSFLEAEIPSVTLSDQTLTGGWLSPAETVGMPARVDPGRLRSWSEFVSSVARRLDGMEGRPAWQNEYLVAFGRVWIRRDLVWVGFGLWVLMVWRGLPGAWRRRTSGERRRVGRAYLPGFAFRMTFLAALLLAPTFAAILLYPLGLLALLGRPGELGAQQAICLLGAVPTLLFAGFLAVGQWAGWFALENTAVLPATLVLLTLASYAAWQLGPTPAAEAGT